MKPTHIDGLTAEQWERITGPAMNYTQATLVKSRFYWTLHESGEPKPCCRGHIAPRHVSSRTCVVCNRENYQRYNSNLTNDSSKDDDRLRALLALHKPPILLVRKA